jgi:hypothetical protein
VIGGGIGRQDAVRLDTVASLRRDSVQDRDTIVNRSRNLSH